MDNPQKKKPQRAPRARRDESSRERGIRTNQCKLFFLGDFLLGVWSVVLFVLSCWPGSARLGWVFFDARDTNFVGKWLDHSFWNSSVHCRVVF